MAEIRVLVRRSRYGGGEMWFEELCDTDDTGKSLQLNVPWHENQPTGPSVEMVRLHDRLMRARPPGVDHDGATCPVCSRR